MSTSVLPRTDIVDVDQAMETLDYVEICALAALFERWALTEDALDPDRRTRLIQMSADYEMIAYYVGPEWSASAPVGTPLSILAKAEIKSQG